LYFRKILPLICIMLMGILSFSYPSFSQEQKTVSIIKEIGKGDFEVGLDHIVGLAKNGNGAATFLYANLHLDVGNIKEFQKYLQLAAEQNNPTAIKFLATSFFKGTFAEPDYIEAKRWFEKGASLRNINSMMYLGILERDGLAGEANPQQAYFWFRLAGTLNQKVPGQKEPEEFAKEIEHLITQDEIRGFTANIRHWLDNNPEVESQGIPPLK